MSSILSVELGLCILEPVRNHLVLDGCQWWCLCQAQVVLSDQLLQQKHHERLLSFSVVFTGYLQDRNKILCYFAASCSWVSRLENFVRDARWIFK